MCELPCERQRKQKLLRKYGHHNSYYIYCLFGVIILCAVWMLIDIKKEASVYKGLLGQTVEAQAPTLGYQAPPSPPSVSALQDQSGTPGSAASNDIERKIYRLESSEGKNDSCKQKGLYNGYGYIPGTCYTSHLEVRALVQGWIKNHQSMGLPQMLCYWNSGKASENCEYYQKYLKL